MQIGMIGLGRMGYPIAENVLKAGHPLKVFNRTRAKAEDLRRAGAESVDRVGALAASCDIVLLCLSDPAAVVDVMLGAGGVAADLCPGTVVADLSTVDVETNRACAAACEEHGAEFLDAPVSGGVGGAVDGTLTVMVGGAPGAFDRARPVLESFSNKLIHVGPLGAGTTVKLVNQMLMGVQLAAVAEAYALSQRAGLEGSVLYDILRESSAASRALDRGMPRFLADDFTPAFSVDLLVKDLELATRIGHEHKSPLLLTHVALQLYESVRLAGLGAEDTTSVVKSLWLSPDRPGRRHD